MRPRQRSYDYRPTALALALAAAFPTAAWANPVAPTVTVGQATFQQSGPALTVTNTPGTVIEWRGFSIGQGELTRFVQQSAASQVLNRVTGGDPSQILGSLQSNGQVFLVNPNGIAFGPNARVDVAGLVASSLGMTNADFLAGRLNFSADLEAGAVRNEGRIRAVGGGSIYLIAPSIENHGVIQAADGAVVLAAGRTVTLVDSNRPDVRVEVTAPGDSALNVGQIVGGHIGIYAGAIRNEGTVSATSAVVGADGTVVFRASTSVVTANNSVTEANGRFGGDISIGAGTASLGGTIRAGGAIGGHVAVDADVITQGGAIRADGSSGAGGRVELQGTNGVLQTLDAATTANGTSGGSITIQSDGAGLTFTSGAIAAVGASGRGGEIHVLGGDIALAGARLDASGALGGGTILVGGDARGANAAIANARTVYASFGTTIRADARTTGDGGKVVLWSDDTTRIGADLSARGGATSGNGGSIEVSGAEHTTFGGTASAAAPHGAAGTFLLDPKNIYIDDATGAISFRDLLDPHPNTDGSAGNGWGNVIEVRGGNTLVTDPYDNAMGARSGAIYVYRGTDGALLTTLTGAAAQDQVGIGERISAGSKLLLVHSLFGSGDGLQAHARGALTWLDPVTGKLSDGTSSGVVSVSNSLVGAHAGDRVSYTADNQFVYPFQGSGTKYFVISQAWNGERGAVTWIDTATGKLSDGSTGGAIGAANSLVGVDAGDRVGGLRATYTYNPLTGFYQTIYQPTYRSVGSGILFFDAYFGGAGVIANAKGAVTWINAATGLLTDGSTGGTVSASNSLLGASAGDHIGVTSSGDPTLLTSGSNALILSPSFGGGKGAVTWLAGATGRLVDGSNGGVVGTSNSFTGSTAGDAVGAVSPTATSGSLYMLLSPEWNGGAGAITWLDMTTGHTINGATAGAIGAANSLVGASAGDRIASNVVHLDSGHYVSIAPDWDDRPGEGQDVGAVTWLSNTGLFVNGGTAVGVLSATTSLVGANAFDRVGSGGILSYGNAYDTARPLLVLSPQWRSDGTAANAFGAVTWLNGTTGRTLTGAAGGTVDATNSLVGAQAGDRIGTIDASGTSGVRRVADSDYYSSGGSVLVASPFWNSERGAVTWIGAAGTTAGGATAIGAVSTTNSVYGETAGDRVGETVQHLSNGHAIIISSQWTNASIDADGTAAGAVTWISGTTGLLAGMTSGTQFGGGFNAIGSANSLVGFRANQQLGSGGLRTGEIAGTVLILSPDARNSSGSWVGAITWMDPATGRLANMSAATDFPNVRGTIGTDNSLLGTATSEFTRASSGYLILTRDFGAGLGALTWLGSNGKLGDGSTGGAIAASNSLVGSDVSEGDSMSLQALSGTSHYVLLTPDWSDGGTRTGAGAVTWISGTTGKLANGAGFGVIGSGNSIVGAQSGDRIGSDGVDQVRYYYTGQIVRSSHWQDADSADVGAVTWFDGNTGLLAGMTSSADFVAGAGVVGSGNSLVGASAGDRVGGGAMQIHAIGDYYDAPVLIQHGDFGGGAGAFTWMRADSGRLADDSFHGVVSTANSLLGRNAADMIGSNGIRQIGDYYDSDSRLKYFILSPHWSDDGATPDAGAVTWIDANTGRLSDGTTGSFVSTSNSLVGSHAGDLVGSGSVQRLSVSYYSTGSRYALLSTDWNASAGAVTWIDGATGLLSDGTTGGVVSAVNSVVGSNPGDRVGSGGVQRVSDDYSLDGHVILSPEWNSARGAVTWFDGATGKLIDGTSTGGVVDGTNSLVGSGLGDRIGSRGLYSLGDSHYLVRSPLWGNGIDAAGAGALTWFDGRTGTLANGRAMTGAVDATNSIVGSRSGDSIGSGDFVTWLSDTGVLVMSPEWNGRRGAVTWFDRNTGLLANMTSPGDFGTVGGTVNSSNSLVGASAGDLAGGYLYQSYRYNYDTDQYEYFDQFQQTTRELDTDRAVIFTRGFGGSVGAVTWMNMATGRLSDGTTGGVIGAANSVVGDRAGDAVGGNQNLWTGYDNDLGTVAYIGSLAWHSSAGAVTWMNADTGALVDGSAGGVVSAANSLVGSSAGDLVGQSRAQSSGPSGTTYLYYSSYWNGGRGAATWMNSKGLLSNMTSAAGYNGAVGATNSLVGNATGDRVTSGGVTVNNFGGSRFFLAYSGAWNGARGAITKIDATTGQLIGGATGGTISAANSLVGVSAGDAIGAVQARALSGGHYLVISKTFGGSRGSVTLVDPGWTLTGQVDATNSVIGSRANAGLQTVGSNNFLQDSANGNSLIRFATDGTGRIVVLKNTLPTGVDPDVHFNDSSGADVTVTPATIVALLNDGTDVLLQATNDIIVRKSILATGDSNSGGALELEAGRNILINANITNLNQQETGLSFAARANHTLTTFQQGFRDAGPGIVSMAPGVVLRVAGDVELGGSSIGTAAQPIVLNTAASSFVTANASSGGIFLRNIGSSTRTSQFDLNAPAAQIVSLDSGDSDLVIDSNPTIASNTVNLTLAAPKGVLTISSEISHSGTVTLQGNGGITILSNVTGGGNVAMTCTAGGIEVRDASVVSTAGTLTINAASLTVNGASRSASVSSSLGTVLAIAGDVAVTGGEGAAHLGGNGGAATGTVGGNLTLTGGSGANASATLFGSPDVGSVTSPLRVGGTITFQSGTGTNAYARIAAALPDSIFINFPNLVSGGYTVDGQAVTSLGGSGFYADGLPAILDQNLHITYGGLQAIYLGPDPVARFGGAGGGIDSYFPRKSDPADPVEGLPSCQ